MDPCRVQMLKEHCKPAETLSLSPYAKQAASSKLQLGGTARTALQGATAYLDSKAVHMVRHASMKEGLQRQNYLTLVWHGTPPRRIGHAGVELLRMLGTITF